MLLLADTVAGGCSVKRMFLKISQNSKETTVPESLFKQSCSLGLQFIKKESLAQVFFCEFCEFFIVPFVKNTSGGCSSLDVSTSVMQLLLKILQISQENIFCNCSL